MHQNRWYNYLTFIQLYKEKHRKGQACLKNKLQQIVPLNATVKAGDLVIYELDEEDGSIKKLEAYNGLPSDENELNEMLGESNELFAQLLEIQQSLWVLILMLQNAKRILIKKYLVFVTTRLQQESLLI